MSHDELRQMVTETRIRQGLPPVIEDDMVLDQVAALLRTGADA